MSYLFLLLMISGALGVGMFSPLWDARLGRREQEQAVARRLTHFTWMVSAMLVVFLLLVPNKPRALLVTPLFFLTLWLSRWWRARRRLREAADLARMKRLN